MKLSLNLFVLFFAIFVNAQIKDLAEMSSGEIANFQSVYDNDDKLFGYFTLFNQGETSDKTRKFEYVLLDKNLNKVSSNTFTGDKILYSYSAFMDVNNDLILAPYIDHNQMSIWGIGKFVYPEYKKIDLKTNKIETYFGKCFENEKFTTCEPNKSYRESRKDTKAEMKAKGYIDHSSVRILKNKKYIVRQSKEYKKFVKDNVIMYFDENEKMQWKHEYNNFADKKNGEIIITLDTDEKAFYGLKIITQDEEKTYKIIVLDINNGKVLAENPINGLKNETMDLFAAGLYNSYYSNTHTKFFKDKIILFNFSKEKHTPGYARIIIDKNDFSVTTNLIGYVKDLRKYVPKLDNDGVAESGYYLKVKDVFFLKDGSVAILTEKFKPAGQYSRMKTTDMVYIYTDKDFKVKDVKILEKEKSKGEYSDYLFSQYLNNDDNVVFYYRDFQKDDESKDKNWILFINTLINGEFKQENIVISSKNDKFMIYPYVAKEGYILLREYNQKDKYNQIRLEKLNF